MDKAKKAKKIVLTDKDLPARLFSKQLKPKNHKQKGAFGLPKRRLWFTKKAI